MEKKLEQQKIILFSQNMPLLWCKNDTDQTKQIKKMFRERKAIQRKNMLLKLLCKEIEQSDMERRCFKKNDRNIKANWAQTNKSRWEWKRINQCTRKNSGNIGCKMEARISNKNKCWSSEWSLSELLQGGYWQSGFKNSYRNRREFTQWEKKTIGFKKGQFPKVIRVESVSVEKSRSPTTVYNLQISGHPSYFAGGVLVHNCHGLTPTIKAIFEQIKAKNTNVRIIGLSATPYRMLSGYIYELTDTEIVEETINPYFKKLVYSIKAEELIDKGYLTPPTVPNEQSESYHAKDLQLDKKGNFNADDIERVFGSDDALTRKIVFDIVLKSADRNAVIVFATTIKHAERILQYLCEADTGNKAVLITGETPKRTREQYLKDFKAGKIKYAVNVAVLTTGFDHPAIDVVAILRPTESAGLFQQIIGRGLRLHEGKHDCLILDYAENIERHKLQGNLFTPEIVVTKGGEKGGAKFLVNCPACGFDNQFAIVAKPDKKRDYKEVLENGFAELEKSDLKISDNLYRYSNISVYSKSKIIGKYEIG